MDICGSNNTRYDATRDFVRFLKVTGQFGNQNSTASIDLDLFNKNFYLASFDLTTSGHTSTLSVSTVPSASTIRTETRFSEGVPYEITQLTFLIYNSCFSIDQHGLVNTTFINSSNP